MGGVIELLLLKVISAEYLEECKVSCEFSDGYTTTVDLEAAIFNDHRPIFAPLRQQSYFKNFTMRWNTICWDNEADFAPEFLYELAQQQEQASVSSVEPQGYAV
jgi:hypothetical protein